MPKFAANVSTMFQEFETAQRFQVASNCGFRGVEFLSPYDWSTDEVRSWLTENELELILLNTQPGDSSKGETGLAALPGREEDFREIFLRAYTYARELGAGMIHLLAGRSTEDVAVCETTFIDNVRWAADLCHGDDINVMLEPLNSTDVPGYLHSTSDETAHLIELIDRDNVKLQYDFYHLQIMEGNLARHIEKHLDKIGHIQFSSVPGRHEPQFGEVNVHHLFDFLDNIGYTGWIGCEYWAIGQTLEGLSWASKYGLGSDR